MPSHRRSAFPSISQEFTRNANRKSGTPITVNSPTVKCPTVRPQRYTWLFPETETTVSSFWFPSIPIHKKHNPIRVPMANCSVHCFTPYCVRAMCLQQLLFSWASRRVTEAAVAIRTTTVATAVATYCCCLLLLLGDSARETATIINDT